MVRNNTQATAHIKDLLAKRQPRILHSQYATFRPDIVEYFVTNVLPKAKVIFDPMAGTAPLIPYVEHLGLTAYFNDILPLYYHVNKAKTYKIYRSISKLKHTVLLSELKQCFLKLKKKQLIMSEKWIRDDILEALSYAWEKTSKYPLSRSTFYKAIIVLSIREYSNVSPSNTNKTWYKPGGITTDKEPEQVIGECIERYFRYYQFYYSSKKKLKGGNIHLELGDASSLKLNKVDTILTSPPYANRYDYERMYAPELYFFSHLNKRFNEDETRRIMLGTNIVTDYQIIDELDSQLLSRNAPKTWEFLSRVRDTGRKGENNYYWRYFSKYYVNLYKMLDNILKLLRKNGALYLNVQNNIHRGELNAMDEFIVDFFSTKGCPVEVVFGEMRSHQGRRNISADHPLVLKKHKETIVKVTKA